MPNKKKSFEENMDELEQIVADLEQGDVPLEESMEKFEKGIKLSKELEKTLSEAEAKLTKVVKDDGTEEVFEPDLNEEK